MFQQTKLAITVGLAALAIGTSSLAATGHFSVGVQGAGGMAFTQNAYTYADSSTEAVLESMKETGYGAIGLFGGHIAYDWVFSQDRFAVSAAVNAGVGKTSTITRPVNDISNPATRGPSIEETIKLREQYNLLVEWKHGLSKNLFFTLGMGASSLKTDNILGIARTTTNTLNGVTAATISQETYLFGGQFKIGAEFFCNAHSAVNFSVNYFLYAKNKLHTYSDILSNGSKDAQVRQRSNSVGLATFAIGYSYYF